MTCSRSVPSSSQMTKVRWTPSRSRPSSAGPAPGEVRTATLVWARHTLTARRRVRRWATTTWASSQGMPARAKAVATEDTAGTTSTSRPNSGLRRVRTTPKKPGSPSARTTAVPRWPAIRRAARSTLPRRTRSAAGGTSGSARWWAAPATSVAAPRAERAAAVRGEPSQPITVTRSAIVVSLQRVRRGRRAAAGTGGIPYGVGRIGLREGIGCSRSVRSRPPRFSSSRSTSVKPLVSASSSPAPSRSSGSRLQTMKSVRSSVQLPSSVRTCAIQASRRTPSLMQPIFWATCWEAVLSAAVRSSTRSNFWSPKQPLGGGERGLGGVALAARPGGDDVRQLGGPDVPVRLGQLDDADQALGEELGDGEVEATALGAFGGRVLGDPGVGRVLGEGLGDVGPGGDLLVVHHLGQRGDVVLVEGAQYQPLRADGDVGEGARHAPLRNLRNLRTCKAC